MRIRSGRALCTARLQIAHTSASAALLNGATQFGRGTQMGSVFLLRGTYGTVLQAANADHRGDARRWEAAARAGAKPTPPPALQLSPTASPTRRSALLRCRGAQLQFAATLLYLLAAAAKLLDSHRPLSGAAATALVTTPYFLGGLGFAVGGYLMALEARHAWLAAALPPQPARWRASGDWVAFFNFAGSCLFFAGGLLLYAPARSGTLAWQLCNGLTFVPGSVCYLAQAVLLTLDVEWRCSGVGRDGGDTAVDGKMRCSGREVQQSATQDTIGAQHV